MSESIEQVLTPLTQPGERFERVESHLDWLELAVTQSWVGCMSRLDRQQDMLASLRHDTAVNMPPTVRAQKADGKTRQDMFQLTEQVPLIHRRLIQLEERVNRSENRP